MHHNGVQNIVATKIDIWKHGTFSPFILIYGQFIIPIIENQILFKITDIGLLIRWKTNYKINGQTNEFHDLMKI